MYFISSRAALDNDDRLSRSDSFWQVEIQEDGDQTRKRVQREDLLEYVTDRHVLFLVHGFNNEFADVVRAFDMIEKKVYEHLSDYYDAVIGYTWPGGDSAWDWIAAKRRAGVIAPRLAQILQSAAGDANVVDVMSHSLGARCVLSGLTQLPSSIVRVQYLMASAVDNESIEQGEKYHQAVQQADESVVFYSKHDSVLRYAYSAAEWDYALGYTGPENPAEIEQAVTIANCKRVIDSHGAYKSTDAIYQFISRWLSGDIEGQFVTV